MGQHPITEDELHKRIDALRKHRGNKTRAANELGVSTRLMRHTARKAEELNIPIGDVEMPDFPDDDIPIDRIIDHRVERFTALKGSFAAHTWFPIKIKDNKPIGLFLVGDPHLDDNGCDWPLLKEHVAICRDTPGIYAVNIGDSTNSWGGRLIRKYADQDTSLKTARRLVEWFLLESGVRWLIWLYGNHEHMGDGGPLLAQMAKRYATNRLAMHDWEARFSLNFPNDIQVKVFAAHDFPGNSMWNPLHGPVKAAKFGNNIDLLVCGHKHNWGMSQWELPEQESTPLMIRVRGYKFMDDYARRIGALEQKEGASILAVINPNASMVAGKVTGFVDVGAGAEYLTWLRSRV